MKQFTLTLGLILWTILLVAQNSTSNLDSLSTVLVGVWEIEKVIDENENTVESITKKMNGSPLGSEIQIKATGPKITLNQDGTYELEFTPDNLDKGNWILKDSSALIFQLVTEKGTRSYNMLKSAAEMFGKKVTFDSDGNIVENIEREIVKLETDEVIIRYETNYYQVYKKRE